MSTTRSERQRCKDLTGREDRIKAVTADLLADLEYFAELNGVTSEEA